MPYPGLLTTNLKIGCVASNDRQNEARVQSSESFEKQFHSRLPSQFCFRGRECKSKSGKISLLKPLIWATELSVMIFSAILNYSSLMDLWESFFSGVQAGAKNIKFIHWAKMCVTLTVTVTLTLAENVTFPLWERLKSATQNDYDDNDDSSHSGGVSQPPYICECVAHTNISR